MKPQLSILTKRFALVPLLFRRPAEVFDRLSKDLELLLDRLRRPPAYPAAPWGMALQDLRGRYPDVDPILAEPPLREIEGAVRQGLQRSSDEGPWSLAYNCDFTLARCLYLVCRVLRPRTVVETGVAYGLSSAFILQALQVNGQGKLYSIDLPPLGKNPDAAVGMLVPDELKQRWELHRGTSRRQLPGLLRDRTVDVFVHDSLHTYRTMRWEFDAVWPHLRPGGVVLSDDVQGNRAFAELRQRGTTFWRVIRQEDKPFLFGIAVK